MTLVRLATLAFCILLVAGCHSTSPLNPLSLLSGHTWELTALSGQDIDSVKFPGRKPTLTFVEEGRLSGFAGCNNFSGGYSLDEDSLNLIPGAMTKMACPGSGEDEFIRALVKVTNFKIEKEKLTLMDGTTELMSFVSKKD